MAKSTVTLTGMESPCSFPISVSQASHPLGSRESHGLKTSKDSERAAGVHLESPFHLRLSFPIFNTSRFLPGLGLRRVLSNEERPLVRDGDLTTQEVDVCGLAQVRGGVGCGDGKS